MKDNQPYFSSRKPTRCPACDSDRVVKIFYGMPTSETFSRAEREEIVLGGCTGDNIGPKWSCLDCQTQIYSDKHMLWHLDNTADRKR